MIAGKLRLFYNFLLSVGDEIQAKKVDIGIAFSRIMSCLLCFGGLLSFSFVVIKCHVESFI